MYKELELFLSLGKMSLIIYLFKEDHLVWSMKPAYVLCVLAGTLAHTEAKFLDQTMPIWEDMARQEPCSHFLRELW